MLKVIFWSLILLASLSRAQEGCCMDTQDDFSCPGTQCGCSSFTGSCKFEGSYPTCYYYSTCSCCVGGYLNDYTNYCPHCSCSSIAGSSYLVDNNEQCFAYVPATQANCCINIAAYYGVMRTNYPAYLNQSSCTAGTGLTNNSVPYTSNMDGCWLYLPLADSGCCYATQPAGGFASTACSPSGTATINYTVTNYLVGASCWAFGELIQNETGCGCSNVIQTSTCSCTLAHDNTDDDDLTDNTDDTDNAPTCNITFFDGSWGVFKANNNITFSRISSSFEAYPYLGEVQTYTCDPSSPDSSSSHWYYYAIGAVVAILICGCLVKKRKPVPVPVPDYTPPITVRDCPSCDGEGFMLLATRTQANKITCQNCAGTGRIAY